HRFVLLNKKLSYEAAHSRPGFFDKNITTYLPAGVLCSYPYWRVDENTILRTRGGNGFDLVTAMWPATDLGAKLRVQIHGRFVYEPMVGFVGEGDGAWHDLSSTTLDFSESPFVCRAVFAERQEAPSFSISGAARGGEVKVKTPALVSGRVYNLTVLDAAGNVRWRFVFDREANAPKNMFVAYTDRPGEWRATLMDCATGLRTEKTFKMAE
ncbi:MAG: hypothetical protein IJG13_09000, partial [Kiritimatiellae bacterium]|nr:hypothetical protein [Kiritimatiellia bacterium]